jgi:hypothetical protein
MVYVNATGDQRSRAFCKALAEETRSIPQRWASITSVAAGLGIEQEEAEAIVAELDNAGLVRVGGGHSVMLEEAGRQLLKTPDARRPSKRSGKARAKARDGRSM